MKPSKSERLTIAVIIPTYNRADYIRSAIDSALNQTRVPDEIVVVDDGSTDATPDILRRYGAPVRMLHQPNRGRSAARNEGLRAAAADAVIFLDSDDILMPHCIDRCAELLENRREIDVVYTNAFVIDGAGRIVTHYDLALRGGRPSGMIFGDLARGCFLTVTSMVRRTSLAGEMFDEGMNHSEDYDLWRRLAARCKFQYLDEPLMGYRFHEGMSVAAQDIETQESAIEVQRRFMAMPEFAMLPRRQRARIYCTHGIKNAMLDRTDVARLFFRKAMRTCPSYIGGIALIATSLLGSRVLKHAILTRRQLAGNQLGTRAGPLAAVNRRPAVPDAFSASKTQSTANYSGA